MSFILEVSQDASAVMFSVSPRLVSRSSVGSGVGALPVALRTDARLPRGVVRLSGAGGGPLCPWAGRCPSLSSAKARQTTPAVCPYCDILLAWFCEAELADGRAAMWPVVGWVGAPVCVAERAARMAFCGWDFDPWVSGIALLLCGPMQQ